MTWTKLKEEFIAKNKNEKEKNRKIIHLPLLFKQPQ